MDDERIRAAAEWEGTMPQASDELRRKWSFERALHALAGYYMPKGHIHGRGVDPTPEEWEAIKFLCDEYDYTWTP